MAKQSILERQKKREHLVLKYGKKRSLFLDQFFHATTFVTKMRLHGKLQKLPRDSAKVRLRNRCWRTGRGRGVYQDFGLCRHMIREMANNGLFPGVYKASW
jgi:small subunit ribosomal protein S14